MCAQSKLRSNQCLAKSKIKRIYSCFALKSDVCTLQSQHQNVSEYLLIVRLTLVESKVGNAKLKTIGESENKYQNEAKGTLSGQCHCTKKRQRVFPYLVLILFTPLGL